MARVFGSMLPADANGRAEHDLASTAVFS
jgi:hypothetical protein